MPVKGIKAGKRKGSLVKELAEKQCCLHAILKLKISKHQIVHVIPDTVVSAGLEML